MNAGKIAAGLVAATVQIAMGELIATALPKAWSPILGVSRAAIEFAPGPIVDATIAVVEAQDKPLLIGGVIGATLSAGTLAGYLSRYNLNIGSYLIAGSGVLAALTATRRSDAAPLSSAAAPLLATTISIATFRMLSRRPSRSLLTTTFLGAIVVGMLARHRATYHYAKLLAARKRIRLPPATIPLSSPPPGTSFNIQGLSPLFTPNRDFYITDINAAPLVVDPETWRLRICGMVTEEVEFTLDELLAMPLIEVDATLICVHNPVGGDRIGTARWIGVPLISLLDQATVHSDAEQILTRSVDGFTACVPIDLLKQEYPVLVVVGMNGEPLPTEHGFPARLLVPGIYGYNANTKWLAELELTTFKDATDFWRSRGWPSAPAHVQTQSRIDVPRDLSTILPGKVTIAGVAWSPPRGALKVEVTIDDMPWQVTELTNELAPTAWRQWRHSWQASPGEHRMRVRVTGQDGLQTDQSRPPYPIGASGYHTISVKVESTPGVTSLSADWLSHLSKAWAELRQRFTLATSGIVSWFRYGHLRRLTFKRRVHAADHMPSSHNQDHSSASTAVHGPERRFH